MTANAYRECAKIYQFPVRQPVTPLDDMAKVERDARRAACHVAAAGGGAWYHDEAMAEAEHLRHS